VQDSDWWPSYNPSHSSNPYAFSMAQTSVPQIYQILKSAFNSQIYVLFEILKSASNSQIHERFSLSPIDVQWRHSRMLQMKSHPLGVWNNDGKATLPDSRWGILEKKKKRKKKESAISQMQGHYIFLTEAKVENPNWGQINYSDIWNLAIRRKQ
jgi:hypothetical protein